MDPRANRTGDDLSPTPCDAPSSGQAEPGLTLVVPVYNEAENFPRLVAEIERHVPRPFRVLVVYDFEEDTTLPVVRELARDRPWLQPLRNRLGRGAANAIRAGFQAVSAGPVLVVMADLSDDLGTVPRMLELYRQGNRIVCASRYMPGGRQIGGPRVKRFLSRLAGWSLHRLAGFPTHDATNNFRLYDAELIRQLGIESSQGFEIALELTAKAFLRDRECTEPTPKASLRDRQYTELTPKASLKDREYTLSDKKAFARGVPIAETPTVWRGRTAGQSSFRLLKWLPGYLRWYSRAMAAGVRRRRRRETG